MSAGTTMTRRASGTGRAAIDAVAARTRHMMGDHACAWSDDERLAWEGLLEISRVLRRDAEARIEREHGVSVSMLGIMGRLAKAPDHALRLTDLAATMGLSISRISRIIDVLETRGIARRTSCPTDARATHIVLQPDGLAQVDAAQQSVHAFVRERFLDRISDDEAATLASVFARLLDDGDVGADCPGADPAA